MHAARDEALRVLLELLEALPHEAHLILRVVDREVRAVPEPLGLGAEDAAAGGVEGEDPDRARDRAEHVHEALAHLARGLVRERDREDLVRLDADRADQMADPVRQHAGLPGARPGDHEQRPFGVQDCLPLGGIQVGEVLLGRGDGHSSMLAAASNDRAQARRYMATRSANAKPSRSTCSPTRHGTGRSKHGPAWTNEWNSPFSPQGSTPGGRSSRKAAS